MSENQNTQAEDHSHDRVFVITFLAVLAVLIGITFLIGGVANTIDGEKKVEAVALERMADRLAPVGDVYTDASQIKVVSKAPAKALSAAEVVDTVCAACHASGVLGATKFEDAADWKARQQAAGGLDGLVKSAIVGKGSMPPKGGDASLTDAQLKAAVEDMLKRAGI